MGYYINPKDQTKEEWLVPYASTAVNRKPKYSELAPGCHFVVLVDNGAFTAAGIAYNEDEFNAFYAPSDNRPKLWFQVPDEKLIEVCPFVEGALRANL